LTIEIKELEIILNIKLIRNNKNLYFAVGNNKAIKEAKGEYICLINYDTVVEPKFIEMMVNFLEKTPDAGIITPKSKIKKDRAILWNTGSHLNFKNGIIIGNRGYLEYNPNNQKYNKIE